MGTLASSCGTDLAPAFAFSESNLTRLLQDSLGGGTKTCIIATVSQARPNMEETLSTLDYALRAKSIKNRPEMNSKASRPGLLQEMEHKCRELWSDLQANLQKEGHFVSDEHWARVQSELESVTRTRDELVRENEVAQAKAASWEEQVEQYTQRDRKRQAEFDTVKSENATLKLALHTREEELVAKEAAIASLTLTGRKLHASAVGLERDLNKCVDENVGLRAKIERLHQIEREIVAKIGHYERTLPPRLAELTALTNGIEKRTADLGSDSADATRAFEAQLASDKADFDAFVATQQSAIDRLLAQVAEYGSNSERDVQEMYAEHMALVNNTLDKAKEQRDAMSAALAARIAESSRGFKQHRTELQKAVAEQAEVAGSLISMGEEHLSGLGSGLQGLSTLLLGSRDERHRAREEEHAAFAQAMGDVVGQLNKLVEASAARLSKNEASEEAQAVTEKEAVVSLREKAGTFWAQIGETQGALKRGHKDIYSSFKREGLETKKQLESISQLAEDELDRQAQAGSDDAANWEGVLSAAHGRVGKMLQAGVSVARTLGEAATEGASSSTRFAHTQGQVGHAFAQSRASAVEEYSNAAHMSLGKLGERVEAFLEHADEELQKQIHPYAPTSKTPKKMRYQTDYALDRFAEALGGDLPLAPLEGSPGTHAPANANANGHAHALSHTHVHTNAGQHGETNEGRRHSAKHSSSPVSASSPAPMVKDMNRPEEPVAVHTGKLAGSKRAISMEWTPDVPSKRYHPA